MPLTNATRPLRRPLTPDARARLGAALVDQGGELVAVDRHDLAAALHDADVTARLREVAAHGPAATVAPDILREAVRFDRQVRDEARD